MKPPILISQKSLQQKVKQLARRISSDYVHKKPVIIGVLKGAFVFMADLFRYLDVPTECEFVMVKSYGPQTKSSGQPRFVLKPPANLMRKDIILIDDIVDTGLTTQYLIKFLRGQRPRSLKVCALLDKPSRRKVAVKIDYCGFKVPNKFIVGYGLDYNEQYRSLPYIGYLSKTHLRTTVT
jgi:hypoxanthine phosphoribosyltransferase